MKLTAHLACLVVASALLAATPEFPAQGSGKPVKGELMEFTMPPYAMMKYRGAEADLREIPLGTRMTFLMLPDENGRLTRLITTDDEKPADEAQRKKRGVQ